MRDLLDRRAEAQREKLQVVPQQAGRFVQRRIGHHQRAGEIVGEADAADLGRLRGAESGLSDDRVDERAYLEFGKLVGELEGARRHRCEGVDAQLARSRVEAAHRVGVGGRLHRRDAVRAVEMVLERGAGVAAGNAEPPGERLGREVDVVDVVVDEVEEVAHFLVGRRLDRRAGAAQAVVEAGKLLGIAPVGLMRGDQRVGEGRRVVRDQLQVLKAWPERLEQRIGQRFRERRQQPLALARGEVGDVDAEGFRQRQQHGGRDRALVVLDLVEIAGRDADAFGEGGLRQPVGVAQLADLAADEQFGVSHIAISHFANL